MDITSIWCQDIPNSTVHMKTRRERLKSAPYLRLKKRKRLFFEKNLKFLIFFSQKMSHSAEKCKRGDPLGFINIYSVAKYQKKTWKGDSFETFSKKVAQWAEKKSKGGGGFILVRFCRLR